MKKILFFSLLIIVILGFITYLLINSGVVLEKQKPVKNNPNIVVNIPKVSTNSGIINGDISPSPTKHPERYGYKSVWTTVNDKNKLYLLSNLNSKTSSNKLATQNSCEYLVNGGFFDTNNNNIGLFITEGEIQSELIDSPTFNGIFSVTKDGSASITRYPVFSPRISLQSGPILFEDGEKLDISIENDQNARRIVVAIDKQGKIYFLAFFDQNNIFNGPMLGDLPNIIERLNNEKGLKFKSALNLDGGNHSAFISNIVNLKEASPIGSFFCIKP